MSNAMKYKRDFLKANRVTVRQFELKYAAFMESEPDEQAYRDFAKRWNIAIHRGLGHTHTEAVLSVQIAVIKVLAASDIEAHEFIEEILRSMDKPDAIQ
jgi:hypothetical protein